MLLLVCALLEYTTVCLLPVMLVVLVMCALDSLQVVRTVGCSCGVSIAFLVYVLGVGVQHTMTTLHCAEVHIPYCWVE